MASIEKNLDNAPSLPVLSREEGRYRSCSSFAGGQCKSPGELCVPKG